MHILDFFVHILHSPTDYRPRSCKEKKLTNILLSGFRDGQQHVEAVLFVGNLDHPKFHCLTVSEARRGFLHEGRKNYLTVTKLKFPAVQNWFELLEPCPWINRYDIRSSWEHRTQGPLGTLTSS